MSIEESFREKQFLVSDKDARIRAKEDLFSFAAYAEGDALPAGAKVGDFKRIPPGTKIKIKEIRIAASGSKSAIVFALAMSADGATEIGWTSTRNLSGSFINETLGALAPASGAGKFGPNAAWAGGQYLGQLDLVQIVDNRLQIERLATKTMAPYFAMVAEAAKSSVRVAINSGFRSYPEQKLLWEGFNKGLPGFNRAAKPGFSNHQNGIAFDIAVGGGAGDPTYDWLTKHATDFGFVRTVSGEPWHWEHDPAKAKKAKEGGSFKTPNVTV